MTATWSSVGRIIRGVVCRGVCGVRSNDCCAAVTTTERGYGWKHQQARKRALARLVDGDPCPFCGLGLFREQRLHFDHELPLALGGTGGDGRLSHERCNTAAGGRLSGQIRRARSARSAPLRTSREW